MVKFVKSHKIVGYSEFLNNFHCNQTSTGYKKSTNTKKTIETFTTLDINKTKYSSRLTLMKVLNN